MIYDIYSNGGQRKVRGVFLAKKDNLSIKYQNLNDFKTKATLKSFVSLGKKHDLLIILWL